MGRRRRQRFLAIGWALVLGTAAWWTLSAEPRGEEQPAAGGVPFRPAAHLGVEVVAAFPHDPLAYTQGLLWHSGSLFESTGMWGRSGVRRVDLETGELQQLHELERRFFGEGLAQVGEQLIQLTWRSGTAFVYDLESLSPIGEHRYGGEGWGLCYDPGGDHLVMSDGSARLILRDPRTFEAVGEVAVTLDGSPVTRLNELECVGDEVYANVYLTDRIVRIDLASGRVTALIDAAGLLTAEEKRNAEVLNGIAYRPETHTFLLTGKNWPRLFEVKFVGG